METRIEERIRIRKENSKYFSDARAKRVVGETSHTFMERLNNKLSIQSIFVHDDMFKVAPEAINHALGLTPESEVALDIEAYAGRPASYIEIERLENIIKESDSRIETFCAIIGKMTHRMVALEDKIEHLEWDAHNET